MSEGHATKLSRRAFIRNSAVAGATVIGATITTSKVFANVRQSTPPWQHRFASYVDEETGVTVYNLTPGNHDDDVVYQTHPMWTQDMRYFMYYSRRPGQERRPNLLDMHTGEARAIEAPGYQRGTMTWHDNNLYYMANNDVFVVDVPKAYHGDTKPHCIAHIPEEFQRYSGDITVDADGSALYFGAQLDEDGKKYAVLSVDLASGDTRIVIQTDFQVGHFQANPSHPRKLMFCWETGGDAPQRTWFVNTDGNTLKPLYKENYDEWVTHEVWWGPDNIIFTIWPYNDTMRAMPHGIAEASLETGPNGEMDIIAQYPAWHTHGSHDRRWALGDDFDRNIWLINITSGERKLLTQGHTSGDYRTHPHGSFTPDSRGLVFTSSKNGVEDVFYVPLPDWETLT